MLGSCRAMASPDRLSPSPVQWYFTPSSSFLPLQFSVVFMHYLGCRFVLLVLTLAGSWSFSSFLAFSVVHVSIFIVQWTLAICGVDLASQTLWIAKIATNTPFRVTATKVSVQSYKTLPRLIEQVFAALSCTKISKSVYTPLRQCSCSASSHLLRDTHINEKGTKNDHV